MSAAMEVDDETTKKEEVEVEVEKTPEEIAEEAEMNRMEAEWAAMTDEEIEQRTRMISHEISVRTTPTPRGFGAGGEGSEGRSRGPMGAVSRVRAGLAHSLLRPPCRNSTVSTAAWCTTSTPRPKTSRTTRCFSPPLFFCCRTRS